MDVPAKFGHYEIVRRLGGSMAEVYLAVDTVARRRVALKLIQRSGDPASLMAIEAERRGAAIQREMRALDTRVVEVYEFGDLDGYFFMAMEYVEGRSLAETLRSGTAIDPVRAAIIALEICEQLAKFHSWGPAVVHGDIKPANVHLGPNDTVRLLDFGIAKTLRAGADATGHDFGSPGYCSPERLIRSQVNPLSDLWAVGATLYEMLAGAPPYQAEDTRKLETLIRSRRPPRALPARCPRALRDIVSKSLAPAPEARYRTAREFQEDLQAFLERRPARAGMEQRPAWSAGATIEAARAGWRRATRTIARARAGARLWRVARAAAWFAIGMALWIGGSLAWRQLDQRRAVAQAAGLPAPPPSFAETYVATADSILEGYRASADPSLHDFDWQKAEVCLQRAADLGMTGGQTLGKLATARGYAALERIDGGLYSEAAAPRMRLYARDQFAAAERAMPQSPEPRLALARLYAEWLPDVEQAAAEFDAAVSLGAILGRREIEQQADAYRTRAGRELASDRQAALRDAQAARALYQRIPGFDRADESVGQLDRMRAQAAAKPGRRAARWR
jgi:hypothetical protein